MVEATSALLVAEASVSHISGSMRHGHPNRTIGFRLRSLDPGLRVGDCTLFRDQLGENGSAHADLTIMESFKDGKAIGRLEYHASKEGGGSAGEAALVFHLWPDDAAFNQLLELASHRKGQIKFTLKIRGLSADFLSILFC